MKPMADQPKQSNPKLAQFLEELNTLQDKYLYILVSTIQVTADGIIPVLRVRDKVPPKVETKKTKKGKK